MKLFHGVAGIIRIVTVNYITFDVAGNMQYEIFESIIIKFCML